MPMSQSTLQENINAIRSLISDEPGYIEVPDSTYGVLFQFEFIPCCAPIPILLWVNPDSQGIFLRAIFPTKAKKDRHILLYEALNEINYSLPIGSFAANPECGEVRFKSTIFIGNNAASRDILINLLGSSGEMISSHFNRIAGEITGQRHVH